MISPPHYLVTGAGGFVGSELVRHLLATGAKVRALVRRRASTAEWPADRVDIVEGDIRNPGDLKPAMEGISGVFHIAALFRQANQPDSAYFEINAQGVQHVIDAAVAARVPRLVHCSTVGVLGHIEHPPATEQTPPHPGDVYQRSKLAGEEIALKAFRRGRIRGVVIRPAMIYGPGDTRTLKLFRMIARKRFFYVGRGDNLVHFIDVRDLARAFRLAMEHAEYNGEIYIIAGAQAVPLRVFAAEIARQLGVPPPWIKLPVKPLQLMGTWCENLCVPLGISPPLYRRRVDFYTKDRSFDGSKARTDLGFAPALSWPDEVKDILRDYQSRNWL